MGKKTKFGGTIGVGYVSIMLIFTVICLTIFAVLSFQAAYSDSRLIDRSEGFTQQYYKADSRAKEILAELDGAALVASQGFDFGEEFAGAASELDGVRAQQTPGGVRVDYSVEINDRQSLAVSVLFYSAPSAGRYDILGWQSITSDTSDDSHQNVWDGGDLAV